MSDQDGFKPMLDQCELTFGAPDDPPRTADASVAVHTTDGTAYTYDAIGMDVRGGGEHGAGELIVMAFDWVNYDVANIREMAADAGIPADQVEEELDAVDTAEPIMMLTAIYPWETVSRIDAADAVKAGFTLHREQFAADADADAGAEPRDE